MTCEITKPVIPKINEGVLMDNFVRIEIMKGLKIIGENVDRINQRIKELEQKAQKLAEVEGFVNNRLIKLNPIVRIHGDRCSMGEQTGLKKIKKILEGIT